MDAFAVIHDPNRKNRTTSSIVQVVNAVRARVRATSIWSFVITFALKAIRFQGIPCARNKRTLKQMFSTEMSRLEKNQRKKCSWIKTFLSRQIYHREPPGLSYWDPLWGAMAAASLLKGSRFKPSIHVLRSRTPAFLSGAIPL
jgi:hypothetical protein